MRKTHLEMCVAAIYQFRKLSEERCFNTFQEHKMHQTDLKSQWTHLKT